MAKRGRPSVYERAGTPGVKAEQDANMSNYSERGKVNNLYQSIAFYQVVQMDRKDPIPGLDKITRRPGCILEQLGRMWEQDRMPPEIVEHYARLAAQLVLDGWKQKDVAQSLRNIRKLYKEDTQKD